MSEYKATQLCNFVAHQYEELLQMLLDMGYIPTKIDTLDISMQHMFLRHDVDLCIERAVALARREAAIGVTSTYYFLISTDLYNLSSAHGKTALREIVSLGHQIGLHFDTTVYDNQSLSLEDAADFECRQLENIAGTSVGSISFHRPDKSLLNRSGKFARRRHTYEPDFFSSIGYISDSNGGWHHGHPLEHPNVIGRRAIQLLTHPIWWCNDSAVETVDVIRQFRLEQIENLTRNLQGTVTAYRDATR